MSFGEILLIGVVALVVLGPERLPAVARTAGALVARLQRFILSVKSDIQQQTDLAGLATLKQDVQDTAHALKAQLTAEFDTARDLMHSTQAELAAIPAEAMATEAASQPDASAVVTEPVVAAASEPDASAVVPEPVVEAAVAPVAADAVVVAAVVAQASVAVPVVNENQLDLFADPAPSSPEIPK
jgi:sec-independent protein translocase protein TatB